jgi:hypothetical protein
MQEQELHHDPEQEDDDRASGEGEILPELPQAHGSQGNEVGLEKGFM